jgi:hypothetical protein
MFSYFSNELIIFQFVGFFSCLIRSDYNFAVIFFCYFVWQQRKDSLALKIVIGLIAVDFSFHYCTFSY